jgi:tocopherol O-methyltransferase
MTRLPSRTSLSQDVANYYDRNTRRFLRFGGGQGTGAIHRQVWAPGVQNVHQAFEYLNHLTARAIEPALALHTPARVLDLGCGVGGSALWLAQRLPVSIVGVTNSAVQKQIAAEHSKQLGLEERCRFILADFMSLPPLGLFNAAYAIESFVHAAEARRFFAQLSPLLVKGGRLMIGDDFLHPRALELSPRSAALRCLQRFKRDWHILNLSTPETAVELAREAGFRLIEAIHLTHHLRQFHPLILRAIYWITQLPFRSAYWQNLSGGSALQLCIQQGLTQYQALIFEKEVECTPSQSNETLSPNTI